MENTIKYKPEVETVSQTETYVDAISVAIPMFWEHVFTGVYANLTRRFIHPEIQR